MRRRVAQLSRLVAGLALVTVAATGCAVGERPTMAEAPTAAGEVTGDPLIDEVQRRLDAVGTAQLNAEYTAVRRMGSVASTVRVAQTSPTRRSVTIGEIRYLTDGEATTTCDLAAGTCEVGIDAQRISDTGLQTPDVVFDGLARRLRLDATAKVGPSSATTTSIAGATAACVDVPLTAGTARYCALDNGVIARYSGGDFSLDLVSYAPAADETLFSTTRDG
jgi:hypothetical protein